MVDDPDQPERPRVEPEIIPPDRNPRRPDWRQQAWRRQTWQPFFSTAADETHRIYVARLGPLGVALLMLIVGVIAAVIVLALVGAVLIWIPAVALLVAVGALFRVFRR
jgi:hypothetical protein